MGELVADNLVREYCMKTNPLYACGPSMYMEVVCVVFEYPMRKFDVATCFGTVKSPHRARVTMRSMCSNLIRLGMGRPNIR